MDDKKLKVAIFGISGYAGRKLLEILLLHKNVEITLGFVASNEPETSAGRMHPRIAKILHINCYNKVNWDLIEKNCDLVFLALPHIVSMSFVPKLLSMGKKVIDLSADYRFSDISIYEKWYTQHTSGHLLSDAVYGLPELYRNRIAKATLVANPGCYPTSALLGLLPLATKGILKEKVIVDSLSGFTGAGRKPDVSLLFAEGNETSKAYNIGQHRHQPEIEHILNKCGCEVPVVFVPHLIPINCGILTTMYVETAQDLDPANLYEIYKDFYAKEPFVRIMDYGVSPEIKHIAGTNFCDIGITKINKSLTVIVSALDNLVKGASGQAVQNMNIMMGFEETWPFFSIKMKPVFLDRDGVISIFTPNDYIKNWQEFKFLPAAFEGLKKLTDNGFDIVIISNQAGVGQGLFSIQDLQHLTKRMQQALAKEGINIYRIYYCPHRKEDNCNCRKPKTGLIEQFISENGDFEKKKTFFVGDADVDIELGIRSGLRTILVLSGKTKSIDEIQSWDFKPEFVAKDIKEAADIIIREER